MEHGGTPKPQLERTDVMQEHFDHVTAQIAKLAITEQMELIFEDPSNMGERWHAGA